MGERPLSPSFWTKIAGCKSGVKVLWDLYAVKCFATTKVFNAVRDVIVLPRIRLTFLSGQSPVVITSDKTPCFSFPLCLPPPHTASPALTQMAQKSHVNKHRQWSTERQFHCAIILKPEGWEEMKGGCLVSDTDRDPCWPAGLSMACTAASPSLLGPRAQPAGSPSLTGGCLAMAEEERSSSSFTKAEVVSGGGWSDSRPLGYIFHCQHCEQLLRWALPEAAQESLKAWNMNMESSNVFLGRSGMLKIIFPAWLSFEHGPLCCEVVYLCALPL